MQRGTIQALSQVSFASRGIHFDAILFLSISFHLTEPLWWSPFCLPDKPLQLLQLVVGGLELCTAAKPNSRIFTHPKRPPFVFAAKEAQSKQ